MRNFWMAALMAAAMWLPQAVLAQGAEQGRRRVELHKEAFFDIRVTESDQANRITAEVAEFMRTHEDAVITVVGYADRETGTPTLNVYYARERAARFRKELVEHYGVDPNRITIDSKGDSVQPFAENARNRCIIVDGYGYEPAEKPVVLTATAQADERRRQYREQRDRRYQHERNRHRTDTIYIHHTDTLWLANKPDTLSSELSSGANYGQYDRNWFVSVGGGPGVFQGDHNVDALWGDRIYPAFNVSLGKWIVPWIGLRAGVELDMVHSYYNANPYAPNPLANKDGGVYYGEFVHGASPDKPYAERPWLYRMDYNAWNFHTDLMVNFSSFMWRPYNRRFWNMIGYVGIGCIATWDNGEHDWFNHAISWNVGILNSFRVSEHFDVNIDLRMKEFDDDFNCFRQGRKMEGITNLTIGASWYFTRRGFRREEVMKDK